MVDNSAVIYTTKKLQPKQKSPYMFLIEFYFNGSIASFDNFIESIDDTFDLGVTRNSNHYYDVYMPQSHIILFKNEDDLIKFKLKYC